MKKKARYR